MTPHPAPPEEVRQLPESTDPATGLKVDTFAVGTFEQSGRAFPALVHSDGRVLDLSERFRDLHEVFDDWNRNFAVLGDLSADSTSAALHLEDLHPLPPLSHPNLLMCGANYKTHVAQMLTKNEFNQHNRLEGESDDDFYARNYAMMERRGREGTPFFWTGLHSSLTGAPTTSPCRFLAISRTGSSNWAWSWAAQAGCSRLKRLRSESPAT